MALEKSCAKCNRTTYKRPSEMLREGWRNTIVSSDELWTCPECAGKGAIWHTSRRGRRFTPPEEPKR